MKTPRPFWRWALLCVALGLWFRFRWRWTLDLLGWCVLPGWVGDFDRDGNPTDGGGA